MTSTCMAVRGRRSPLVGSTGAGKTTITNLINRFYDIQKGRILYDGHDIKSIEKGRAALLWASSWDTHLFTGTVGEHPLWSPDRHR